MINKILEESVSLLKVENVGFVKTNKEEGKEKKADKVEMQNFYVSEIIEVFFV